MIGIHHILLVFILIRDTTFFMLNIRLRRYLILNAKLCIKGWKNIYEWFLLSSFDIQHLDSCACVMKTTWPLSSHRIYRRHMCRSPANPSVVKTLDKNMLLWPTYINKLSVWVVRNVINKLHNNESNKNAFGKVNIL